MRLASLAVLAPFLMAAPLFAEMAGEDYQTDAGALSADERAAVRARLAEEIAGERARVEEAAKAAAAEVRRREAEWAAQPLGDRLVETRCLTCHDQAQIDAAEFGTLGWTMTVLRMDLLNGARLEHGERSEIVRHLADRNPGRSRWEWTAAVIAGVTAAGAAAFGLRRLRQRAS